MALAAGQRTAFSAPDDAVGWPGLLTAEPAERAGWRVANPRPHDCKADALPLRRSPFVVPTSTGIRFLFHEELSPSFALLDLPNALLIVQN